MKLNSFFITIICAFSLQVNAFSQLYDSKEALINVILSLRQYYPQVDGPITQEDIRFENDRIIFYSLVDNHAVDYKSLCKEWEISKSSLMYNLLSSSNIVPPEYSARVVLALVQFKVGLEYICTPKDLSIDKQMNLYLSPEEIEKLPLVAEYSKIGALSNLNQLFGNKILKQNDDISYHIYIDKNENFICDAIVNENIVNFEELSILLKSYPKHVFLQTFGDVAKYWIKKAGLNFIYNIKSDKMKKKTRICKIHNKDI